jgi:hypothetical protein
MPIRRSTRDDGFSSLWLFRLFFRTATDAAYTLLARVMHYSKTCAISRFPANRREKSGDFPDRRGRAEWQSTLFLCENGGEMKRLAKKTTSGQMGQCRVSNALYVLRASRLRKH